MRPPGKHRWDNVPSSPRPMLLNMSLSLFFVVPLPMLLPLRVPPVRTSRPALYCSRIYTMPDTAGGVSQQPWAVWLVGMAALAVGLGAFSAWLEAPPASQLMVVHNVAVQPSATLTAPVISGARARLLHKTPVAVASASAKGIAG